MLYMVNLNFLDLFEFKHRKRRRIALDINTINNSAHSPPCTPPYVSPNPQGPAWHSLPQYHISLHRPQVLIVPVELHFAHEDANGSLGATSFGGLTSCGRGCPTERQPIPIFFIYFFPASFSFTAYHMSVVEYEQRIIIYPGKRSGIT
jgi:hypothetical protein